MNENPIESLLVELSRTFQWPILLMVLLVFAYALLKLGAFFVEGRTHDDDDDATANNQFQCTRGKRAWRN